MHVEGFWLEKNKWSRRWFVAARKRHSIHHCTINDEGLMINNFGIGLFLFDRLFGTLGDSGAVFNYKGYAAAQRRFSSVIENHVAKAGATPGTSGACLSAKNNAAGTLTRAGIAGAILTLILIFPSCGTGSIPTKGCFLCTNNNHYLYTANAAGNTSTVSALASDATSGQITPIAGSPYGDSGSGALALAKAPLGGPLYIANNFSGNISAFAVDPLTGKLSVIVGSPFPAEAGMDSIAIDPSGTFLYSVSGDSANLWAYSISNGALAPLGNIPMLISASANGSSSVVMDPSGKYLYVTSQNSLATNIYGFSRDANTGALTALSGFPMMIDGFANKSTFDPSGKFLLVTGTDIFGALGGIDIFSLNTASGALTLTAGSPVQVGADPAAIVFDPLGKYVYVPNTADETISGFTFDSTAGTLMPISGSPFPSGGKGTINGPLGIAVDTTEQFMFVCNASNDISVFSLNSTTGALMPIAGSPFPSGGNGPSAIVFVP
jgi:6-phosphogluconolactonase (cycloisomerase 2 family)